MSEPTPPTPSQLARLKTRHHILGKSEQINLANWIESVLGAESLHRETIAMLGQVSHERDLLLQRLERVVAKNPAAAEDAEWLIEGYLGQKGAQIGKGILGLIEQCSGWEAAAEAVASDYECPCAEPVEEMCVSCQLLHKARNPEHRTRWF